ncbi:SWIM zinc finger family protein [Acidiferrobacter sp.]|uniref:SWIM zinc finger family protein n=1 Tax=Acidiferrobacter sp. TaxID=1872107 RepID=UPI00262B7E68|nr:SWIM zinc finger family protein [Acidiferrobacter sp.]
MRPKVPHTHKPADLTPVDWQRALRRQFGREQAFPWENIGDEAVFSDFHVTNPATRSRYRVVIRGLQPDDNRCSCPDFATNELGTCKHVEFVLGKFLKKRGAKAVFARGYQPAFSELALHNDGRRSVRFRPGTSCPAVLRKAAARLFEQPGDDLRPDRSGDLESFVNAVAKVGHELRVPGEVPDFVAGLRDAAHRARTLDRLFPGGRRRLEPCAVHEACALPLSSRGRLIRGACRTRPHRR